MFEGTSQTVTVNITPEHATCIAEREGATIGSVQGPSGALHISKSRHDVILKCSADGYKSASSKMESSASTGGVASIFFFDFGITDYATGALNKYPETISVTLLAEGSQPDAKVKCRTKSGIAHLSPQECKTLKGRRVN